MHNGSYAYVRVSTREQNEQRQINAVKEFGIETRSIFVDHQSGKDFERPAYKRLVKTMRAGDVLVIKSIDRLGRNYEEILHQWRFLTKHKKVSIVVLDMPLLDTRRGRDLTGTLIADIVLQLLSYVAQTERENIRLRQAEGIAAARARGIRFGRPSIPIPENFQLVHSKYIEGSLTSTQAAAALNTSRATFLRWNKRRTPEKRVSTPPDGQKYV